MNPQEKAQEIVNSFYWYNEDDEFNLNLKEAEICALICVNNILSIYEKVEDEYEPKKYWLEVKQDIINNEH